MLYVKFRQVDDTKQAVRDFIVYQKYFHPIQTMTVLTEAFHHLGVAKKDKDFLDHMKTMYERMEEKIDLEMKLTENMMDADLKYHI